MTTSVILTNNNNPIAVTSAPRANSIPIADSNGTLNSWINSTSLVGLSKPIVLEFSHGGGVPSNGYRYLKFGITACSSTSAVTDPITNFSVISVAIEVNTSDTNNYDFEIITNPTAITFSYPPGAVFNPTKLAITSLVAGATSASGGGAANIPAGTEIGVRAVRTSGTTASSFSTISVLVLLS